MAMDFSEMLEELARFQKMKRANWNGKDQYIFLLPGSAIAEALIAYTGEERITVDSIFIKTTSGSFGPYTPSNCDILARDWEVYLPPDFVHEPMSGIHNSTRG